LPLTANVKSDYITTLLNGTIVSLKNIVPINHTIGKPQLSQKSLQIQFGVLIGITGDVKGKLVLSAEKPLFGAIGEAMFGMPLQDEMLVSFSGELGNMLAGGLSTIIVEKGITTDITAPTIMDGNTMLSGYERSLVLPVTFESIGELNLYLLLD
jgi:chemotaxis protein CheX